MGKIVFVLVFVCGFFFFKKIEKAKDDSKSGMSAKDPIPELLITPAFQGPNPLDRPYIQWNPPIINPPPITNVNP